MADEIKVLTRFKAEQGKYAMERAPGEIPVTWNGALTEEGVKMIGTSWVSLTATYGGWLWVKNLDATTKTIDLGVFVSSSPEYRAVATLEPGEVATFRLHPSALLYVKASASDCPLEYRILSD